MTRISSRLYLHVFVTCCIGKKQDPEKVAKDMRSTR